MQGDARNLRQRAEKELNKAKTQEPARVHAGGGAE